MTFLRMARYFLRDQSGNAAVEFAFVAPVLILMLIGLYDFGMYINQKMQLENLARGAAEYMIKGGTEEGIRLDVIGDNMTDEEVEEVELASESICECNDGEVIECSESCEGGDYKRQFFSFSMTRDFSTTFPYPGIPDTISMTGNARLQVE